MDSSAYRKARLEADAHVQIRLVHEESWPNTARVVGKVARVFKDRTGALKRGQTIAFDQPFASRLDPDAGPSRETWARAQAAEVYLLAYADRDWRVTCDQFTLLRRTTHFGPVNPADTDRGWFAEGPGLAP